MKLATFDIFDTTLIRKCGRPDVVAHIVAVRLWPDCEMAQCEYINARRQAAVAGRTTIEEFYSAEELSALSGYTADEIMHAEMDVESEMLMANVAVQEQIACLRAEGWTIKFLSDMYLPSSLLKQVLLREGCAEADDEVIVSCEWNARKDSGELYRRVREAYGPAEWRHYGDNRHSDYKMARRYGVKATLVNSEFTPMEQRISAESARLRDGWRYDLLAGLSRTARLSCGDTPANRLAADYVAALYVPFVVWVLRSAEMAGIRRLHFLSRDGYVMMKIAEALGTDLQLNYLFVSRKALMRAYLSENAAQRYLEIADRKTIVRRYVDVLLSQLQLDRNSLAEQYGIRFDYNRIVTSVQQQDFVDKIFNHPQFTP
ncbi:MAG: hypothetical protein J1E29_08180, partial [Duncaniella sp.]|nr:hypothetical protein [Duncaniella sp.]